MLDVMSIDSIEDPIETQDRVKYHCSVVAIAIGISASTSEQAIFTRRKVEEAPVVDNVPERAIQGVDHGECDVYCLENITSLNAVQAQSHVIQDGT